MDFRCRRLLLDREAVMNRRKYHLAPPANATFSSGQVLELSAADDAHPSPPSAPVELVPMAAVLTIDESRSENDSRPPSTESKAKLE
jgi:hypothetical protein